MKYLLLFLLMSCGFESSSTVERIKKQAFNYCSCHGGLDYLVISTNLVDFKCMDGSYSNARFIPDLDQYNVYSGCR